MSQDGNGTLQRMPQTPSVFFVNNDIEQSQCFAEIQKMSAEEREADQKHLFTTISNGIIRLATHVYFMERFDPVSLNRFRSDFGNRFTDNLRMISGGKLDPDIFCRYWAKNDILRRVSQLPLADQKSIAASGRVPLLVIGPTGVSEMRPSDPYAMDNDQLSQVFSAGRIRDQHEQAVYLDRKREQRVRPKIPDTIKVSNGRVKLDTERAVATFPKGGDYALCELDEICRLLRRGQV